MGSCNSTQQDKSLEAVDQPVEQVSTSEAHPALVTVDLHEPLVDVSAPLDDRDIDLVQQTWARATMLSAEHIGWVLFMNIFEIAPEAKGLFPFKDEEELACSTRMRDHGAKVVATVGTAVSLLRDLDTLVPVLESLGLRHMGYAVRPEHYDVVGQALIKTLHTALGEKMTPVVTNAYLKVYTIVKSTMLAKCDYTAAESPVAPPAAELAAAPEAETAVAAAAAPQATESEALASPKDQAKMVTTTNGFMVKSIVPRSKSLGKKSLPRQSLEALAKKATAKAKPKITGPQLNEDGMHIVYLPIELNGNIVLVKAGGAWGDGWRVTNDNLKASSAALAYRNSKCMEDRSGFGAEWDTVLLGSDEGDGWFRCLLEPEVESGSEAGTSEAPLSAQFVTTATNFAHVWDANTGISKFKVQHHDLVNHACFDPTGQRILTVSADKTARVWDAKAGKQQLKINLEDIGTRGSWDEAGGRIAICIGKKAQVWDASSGSKLVKFKADDATYCATFDKAGERIAVGSEDCHVRIFPASGGKELLRVTHTAAVFAAQFHPSGQRLLTASGDSTARIWDLASGKEVVKMSHRGLVFFANYNPVGDKVLTTSADRTAVIWDAAVGKAQVTVASSGQQIWFGGWCSSGTRFATGAKDKACRVWDSSNGKEILKVMHDGPIKSVHFSSAAF